MAAINIRRQLDQPWAHGRAPVGTAGRRRSTGHDAALAHRRPVPRPALPDRATRVRRRRLAVLVLAVSVAGGLALTVQSVARLAAVGETPEPEPVDLAPVAAAGREYVVQPGDTLWSIAERIAPGADPRPVVDALRAVNGGPELEVGTRLVLDVDG